jgi:hypothetical protein
MDSSLSSSFRRLLSACHMLTGMQRPRSFAMNSALLTSNSPRSVTTSLSKLNDHIRHLMKGLEARGESTYDLLSFLFKALATVPDARFRSWVDTKRGEYDEGHPMIDGEPLIADSMMILSKNKLKGMKQDGTCNFPSPEDEKIVSLQAEAGKLQFCQARRSPSPQSPTWGKSPERHAKGNSLRDPVWPGRALLKGTEVQEDHTLACQQCCYTPSCPWLLQV